MNIGDKIKNAREENKLTQTQVSEILMVSRQTISNWENGKSLPDILSVIRMAWISILAGAVILTLGNIFEGNPVIEFLNGAIPWILLGLTFLFWILSLDKENIK